MCPFYYILRYLFKQHLLNKYYMPISLLDVKIERRLDIFLDIKELTIEEKIVYHDGINDIIEKKYLVQQKHRKKSPEWKKIYKFAT